MGGGELHLRIQFGLKSSQSVSRLLLRWCVAESGVGQVDDSELGKAPK